MHSSIYWIREIRMGYLNGFFNPPELLSPESDIYISYPDMRHK